MVDLAPEFLAILCCPVSRKPLVQLGAWLISTDPEGRLRYPIRNEIPVLLEEEAEKLDLEAWKTAIAAASSTLGPAVEGEADGDEDA
jgi:uncharacterized protein YbaR (Trm112 family)